MKKIIASFAVLLAIALFTAQTAVLPTTAVLPNTTALAASAGSGTVAFEQVCHGNADFATTASCSITLGGASSSRAVEVSLDTDVNTISGITCSVGATSLSLVSGADSTSGSNRRCMIFGAKTSLTGAQTASCSWTGAADIAIGSISATGVNQTTSFNNGTFSTTILSGTHITVAITSTSGDLTVSNLSENEGSSTTNQTQKWIDNDTTNIFGYGDIGPGTGTTTHTWTNASMTNASLCGANFVHQ